MKYTLTRANPDADQYPLQDRQIVTDPLEEEVNKLEWVSINDNFFNMNKYAGEGNIGHIIEEIKIDINSK